MQKDVMMSLILRAAGAAALFAMLAPPASALETDRTALSPAALRARSMATEPTMTSVRTFTVIPASTSAASLKTLEAYFESYGFSVKETPNLKDLVLTGTLAAAGKAAHASFSSFTASGETIVRATPFEFPAQIAHLIRATSFVPGAHARPLFVKPALVPNGPSNGYGPDDIAKLYDIAPVYADGVTGSSQTVAVAACSSISSGDLSRYDALFGLPAPKITVVRVDGTSTAQDGEAILDVERVHGTAPGAAIRL